MTEIRRLSTPLQIDILKKRFAKLNPSSDLQGIDWEGVTGDSEVFAETVHDFIIAYPQYTWEENNSDPYYFQVVQALREQADDYGFDIIDKREHTKLLNSKNNKSHTRATQKKVYVQSKPSIKTVKMSDKFELPKSYVNFKLIAEDLKRFPIVVLAQNDHGKSTSVKTLIQQVRNPTLSFKIFDVSQSWYHNAPVKWRQRIFKDNMDSFPNVTDCVYEIGSLSEDDQRDVVARIIKQDYDERYFGKLFEGPDMTSRIPWIIYVFEECETYFDSRSLNRKDEAAEVFRKCIKVGRNYGIRGIMIVQVMHGELATKIRRRSGLLMGQVVGDSALRAIKNRTNRAVMERVKSMPRFFWTYWNGAASSSFRILDLVRNTPKDYKGLVYPRARV